MRSRLYHVEVEMEAEVEGTYTSTDQTRVIR